MMLALASQVWVEPSSGLRRMAFNGPFLRMLLCGIRRVKHALSARCD